MCFLIFLAACGGMGYIGYYAISNGDPDLILAPMDADGNFCGKTPGFEEYPYLWYQDIGSVISWLPYGVCIKECPTATQMLVPCKGTSNVEPVDGFCTPVTVDGPSPYATISFLKKYCVPNVD